VPIKLSWPSLGGDYLVIKDPSIGPLQPNQSSETDFQETPATAGLTIFTLAHSPINAEDGQHINLFLPDGRRITGNTVIGGVRARSREEIRQSISIWIAAVSLIILVAFQIGDWLFRYSSNNSASSQIIEPYPSGYAFLAIVLGWSLIIFYLNKGRNAWDVMMFNSTLAIIALFMIGLLENSAWDEIVWVLGAVAIGSGVSAILKASK